MIRAMIIALVVPALAAAGCAKKDRGEPAPTAAAPNATAHPSTPPPPAPPTPPAPEPGEGEKEDAAALPSTIDEAVDFILAEMGEEDKKTFKETPRDDLIKYHHGFGTAIRNRLGLWSGNSRLMEATKKQHPDDASMVIIEALWDRLQKE